MTENNIPLVKAIDEFLKDPAVAGSRLELSRFAIHCGKQCPMFMVTAKDVKEFAMEVKKAAERKKRIEALEAFFEFAKGNGWVRVNLAGGLIKKKESPVKKKTPVKPKREVIRISADGRQKIGAEIEDLLKDKARVINEVASAREEGDLSENAGYHDARERLALIEAQIREREDILARAEALE